MSLYSVSFAPRNSEPEILYFDNQETANNIGNIIDALYLHINVDVKESPKLDNSRVKVETGLTKDILDKIFTIKTKSYFTLTPPHGYVCIYQWNDVTQVIIKSTRYLFASDYSINKAFEILNMVNPTSKIDSAKFKTSTPFIPGVSFYDPENLLLGVYINTVDIKALHHMACSIIQDT